ncbi:MAG: MFS transporter [Acidobacteria bacterium]|nr:MFS transporter [Acidobacteriota bacterium]
MTLVLPLLAIYAETFHATPLQATLLVSVFAACQLVSGPVIGNLSDRFGRKRMLLVSQAGTFLGFLVMARAHTLWVLYLARVLDGSTAGNLSLAQAYISDSTPPHQRAQAFGLIGVAFGIGFFIGPSLTGFLAAHHGMTTPIYLAACMSALSILCTATLLKEGAGRHRAFDERRAVFHWRTYTTYFGRPELRGRLLQFLCFITAFSLFISGFALFAERRFTWDGRPFGPREIGVLFGYVGLLGIILQGGLIGRLVDRFGESALVAGGFTVLALGYFGLGFAAAPGLLLVAGTFAAFGNGVIRPAVTSLITQHAGRHEQGIVAGITQALMSMASIVAPVVAGWLIQRQWLTAWAWTAALLAAVGALMSRGALFPRGDGAAA